MSEPQPPETYSFNESDLRALLIFLSTAKAAYEFVGRQVGDGEERFAFNRLAIEELSIKLRGMLSDLARRQKEQKEREIPVDKVPVPADILAKETGAPD